MSWMDQIIANSERKRREKLHQQQLKQREVMALEKIAEATTPMNYFWHRQHYRIEPTTFSDGSPAFVVKYGGLDYARFATEQECQDWIDRNK